MIYSNPSGTFYNYQVLFLDKFCNALLFIFHPLISSFANNIIDPDLHVEQVSSKVSRHPSVLLTLVFVACSSARRGVTIPRVLLEVCITTLTFLI